MCSTSRACSDRSIAPFWRLLATQPRQARPVFAEPHVEIIQVSFCHTNSSTHVALTCLLTTSSLLAVATVQVDSVPTVCKYRPYKVLCTTGFDHTAECISKYSLERRYSHSLFLFWEIRQKRSCPGLQITVKLKYELWAFQRCAFSPRCLLFTVQCWLKNSTFHPQSLWRYYCLALWKTGIKDRGTDKGMRN